MQFYVGDDDRPEWIITVDDPGYGRIHVDHVGGDTEWSRALWGKRLGRFTAHLTQVALLQDVESWRPLATLGQGWTVGLVDAADARAVTAASGCSYATALDAVTDAAGTPLPPFLTVQDARRLLSVVVKATLLAAAGTDRYERLYPEVEDEPPLCVGCGLGSPFTGAVSVNHWCEQHGHRPFGEPAGTTWEAPLARYQRRTGAPAVLFPSPAAPARTVDDAAAAGARQVAVDAAHEVFLGVAEPAARTLVPREDIEALADEALGALTRSPRGRGNLFIVTNDAGEAWLIAGDLDDDSRSSWEYLGRVDVPPDLMNMLGAVMVIDDRVPDAHPQWGIIPRRGTGQ